MAVNGVDNTLTGRVVSVNDKGLKFEGAGEWINVSKYAVGVVLPERGAEVTVTLDKAGFLRAVQPADGHSVAGLSTASTSASTPASNGAPGASSGQHRDRTITRLAVLKAAAEYATSKPTSSSADVLKIAAAWERWVLRDAETDDLTDAF